MTDEDLCAVGAAIAATFPPLTEEQKARAAALLALPLPAAPERAA